MTNTKTIGRLIGVLLLAHLLGQMAGFMSLIPTMTAEYLNTMAPAETRVRAGVIILMFASVITAAITVVVYPLVREMSARMAIVLVIAAAFWVVMQTLDDVDIMSMLSLSKRSVESAGASADLYNFAAVQLRSTRIYAHYAELLAFDVWYAALFGAMLVLRLVPRWVSGIALAGVAVHAFGLPIAMFAGYAIMPELAYGILASYVVVIVWSLLKGFDRPASLSEAYE